MMVWTIQLQFSVCCVVVQKVCSLAFVNVMRRTE